MGRAFTQYSINGPLSLDLNDICQKHFCCNLLVLFFFTVNELKVLKSFTFPLKLKKYLQRCRTSFQPQMSLILLFSNSRKLFVCLTNGKPCIMTLCDP